MKAITCWLAAVLSASICSAQIDGELNSDLQLFTDEVSDSPDGNGDYEAGYENLLQIRTARYDLNSVSGQELQLLHMLNDRQIEDLLKYRETHGPFLDVHELQVLPGFDLATIAMLLPHVMIRDPLQRVNKSLLRRIASPGNGYFITRLERTLEAKKGFTSQAGQPASFRGSPEKIYFTLRTAVAGDFSLGITGEKDAGEKMGFDPGSHHWGLDFTSYHVQLRNKGRLKNFIAGDYQAQFGQGLLLGGAFGLGKGAESVSTTRKSNTGFLPYTSAGESGYQRGVAFTMQLTKQLSLSGLYSATRRDATLDSTPDSLSISSLQTTGYHRTAEEFSKRKKVAEQSFGAVAQFDKGGLQLGIIVHHVAFDHSIERNPTLYNGYSFSGRRNTNTGFFLNYRLDNLSFFGEFGHTVGAGSAGLAGVLASLHPSIDIAILFRSYMRNFHSFTSNAFSENTLAQNEQGVYWGWKFSASRRVTLTGYVDLFRFPWIAFRRYSPSTGSEWMGRFRYQPSRTTSAFLQVRQERKARNTAEVTPVYRTAQGIRTNATTQFDYGLTKHIRLRARIQYNRYELGEVRTEGFAMLQDVTLSHGRFKLTARHALFDTDHYDNRHYVYEHDAWLAYSLPAYTGTGVRNYALLEIKVLKRLTLWVRYARTALINTEEIGSALDVIEGNTRNDVKFQVRIRF